MINFLGSRARYAFDTVIHGGKYLHRHVAKSGAEAPGNFKSLFSQCSQGIATVKMTQTPRAVYRRPVIPSQSECFSLLWPRLSAYVASVASNKDRQDSDMSAVSPCRVAARPHDQAASSVDKSGTMTSTSGLPLSAIQCHLSSKAIDLSLRPWVVEEIYRVDRTAEIAALMQTVCSLCNAAHETATTFTDTALAQDLSKVFGDMIFTPDDARNWRRDVANAAKNSTRFAESHQDLIGFTACTERQIVGSAQIPAPIVSFMEEHQSPTLLVTDEFAKKGETDAVIQLLRAVSRAAGRRDALLFPLANNQDALTLALLPPGMFRELQSYRRAATEVSAKLVRGQADAEINRAAVEAGSEFPSSLIASSSAPKAAAVRASHRDPRWTKKVTNANCDSLMQYILRLAIGDVNIFRANR
ncbi:hypothetical protein [Robbsia andropogonis]|uniref:hypothetical protein n=1 Tax=Robbsia andropogonis TaxID=28092 RepID=UPI0004B9E931|nr:hypothetical protein [Robbsia andropogonis]